MLRRRAGTKGERLVNRGVARYKKIPARRLSQGNNSPNVRFIRFGRTARLIRTSSKPASPHAQEGPESIVTPGFCGRIFCTTNCANKETAEKM